MWVQVSDRDSRPIYVQIMDEIRRAVVRGSLRAEDPLPSVRELSAELVVNPRTVLQAYRELERDGVVYVRRGQGTFVSPASHADAAERTALIRDAAKRALLEARRSGLGLEDLIETIRAVAADEEREDAQPAGTRSRSDVK